MGQKKLAVLVGCNYPNTRFKLHGCVNDVVAMRDVLVKRLRFDPNHVEVLTDAPGSSVMPTGANIKAALDKMMQQATAGDILFFHFSGHGTLIPSLKPSQPFRQDEAIVPCDLNLITDVDMRHLVNQLPKGVSFTMLSDSCHSGGLIDKEKEQIGPSTIKSLEIALAESVSYRVAKSIPFQLVHEAINTAAAILQVGTNVAEALVSDGIGSLFSGVFGKDVSVKFRPQQDRDLLNLKSLEEDEGILISGCQANETSADVVASKSTGGKAYGAFSNAVRIVLSKNLGELSNKQLVMMARKVLEEQGFEQHPCLYCSDANADAAFLQQSCASMHKLAFAAC